MISRHIVLSLKFVQIEDIVIILYLNYNTLKKLAYMIVLLTILCFDTI